MSTRRGRQLSVEERQERERAWSADQKEREKAWTAEFEQRQKAAAAESYERGVAQEREAWAKGERAGNIGYLDVTGPDGRRVRLAVVWLGRFRATSKRLNDYDPLRGFQAFGDGALLLIPLAALVGLNFALRWAVLRLLGRPRWAVAAAVGPHVGTSGNNLVLRRFQARQDALRYAAALADEVERDGEAALTPR
ncbi:hypothetical protein [Kitasatospora sp. SUK 42]|uniref:hypothetical protein n=1 Tax=Kitasatospora sp. SUK 42 TaxID=1588882 RepID=UPI0018CB8559|nr:hypothetical protein [Kitasatospora sp. SUK 42]MBV2154101.1 hypothetical protein [Kitasatospora sp. SUK 42]